MIRIVRLIAVAILALVALVALVAAAPPPLTLDIRQPLGNSPFYTRVRITLEPNEGNRWLCLQWTQFQGGAKHGSSCQSLEGDTAARTHWQQLKELASGKWSVVAYVLRSDESRHISNAVTLHVLGPNYEMDPEP